MLEAWVHDLRLACRSIARKPGFATAVVLTLTLGIGATVGIFSVLHGVLLRPLPYDEPDRIVRFLGMTDGQVDPADTNTIAYLDFEDWRRLSGSFSRAAAYDEWKPNLTGSGEPERLEGALVNWSFFEVLGVEPAAGRFFAPEEDVDGRDRVVVLSHGLWQRRFGGDASVLGTSLDLNGAPHTVVGVAPRGFVDPLLGGASAPRPELWRPLGWGGVEAERLPNRGSESYVAIARLAPGVRLEYAKAEVEALAAGLEQEHPETNTGRGATLAPLRETMVGAARPSLVLLLGAVALVLAIAVANVSSLLLGRSLDRRRETSVRAALGASRGQLLRLFVSESLVLGALGGILGVVFAWLLLDALVALAGESVPLAGEIRLDWPVLAFAAAVTLGTALASALAPALLAGRRDLLSPLKEEAAALASGLLPRLRLRGLLVVFEVALSIVLLTGAGLLARSFWELYRVDPGLDAAGVLTFDLAPSRASYREEERLGAFYQDLLDRLEHLPGAEAVAAVNIVPLSGGFDGNSVSRADLPPPEPGREQGAQVRSVTPGFFRALGLELLEGRVFTGEERPGSPPVAVVSRALAERFWPGESPLGRRLRVAGAEAEVVGVVADVKHLDLAEESPPHVFVARDQGLVPWQTRRMSVVLRTAGDPMALLPLARREVRALDPNLPLSNPRTMEQILFASVEQPRFRTLLLGAFAAAALALAAVGLYGVLSAAVVQRRLEIAIRMALGAQRGSVLARVVRQGLGWVALGTVFGLAAALPGARLLEGLLFGVSPVDPLALLGVPAVLAAVALAACYLPARRAAAIEPMRVLRGE